jgi:hypothetical protein
MLVLIDDRFFNKPKMRCRKRSHSARQPKPRQAGIRSYRNVEQYQPKRDMEGSAEKQTIDRTLIVRPYSR